MRHPSDDLPLLSWKREAEILPFPIERNQTYMAEVKRGFLDRSADADTRLRFRCVLVGKRLGVSQKRAQVAGNKLMIVLRYMGSALLQQQPGPRAA
jgi:hypothetical protein